MLFDVAALLAMAVKVIEHAIGFFLLDFLYQNVFREVEAGFAAYFARGDNGSLPDRIVLAPFISGADAHAVVFAASGKGYIDATCNAGNDSSLFGFYFFRSEGDA